LKLRDAIIRVLEEAKSEITNAQIAETLNSKRWFRLKKHPMVTKGEIHRATMGAPAIFIKDGARVQLASGYKKVVAVNCQSLPN